MPQRHHQGHKRTPKQLALIIKRCLPMVLTGSGMLCTTANAEEYYFDPIMLETTKSGMQTTDLSRFSKKYLITHDPQPASRADMASEGLPRLHAPIQPTCS